MSAEDLYQEVILDHYRNPRNYGKMDSATHHAREFNPVCGDEVDVFVALDSDQRVADIQFQARGCAISVASASMMTELLRGCSTKEIQAYNSRISEFFNGKLSADALEDLGDFSVLKGVLNFPVRIKCVLLSWLAVQNALGEGKTSDGDS